MEGDARRRRGTRSWGRPRRPTSFWSTPAPYARHAERNGCSGRIGQLSQPQAARATLSWCSGVTGCMAQRMGESNCSSNVRATSTWSVGPDGYRHLGRGAGRGARRAAAPGSRAGSLSVLDLSHRRELPGSGAAPAFERDRLGPGPARAATTAAPSASCRTCGDPKRTVIPSDVINEIRGLVAAGRNHRSHPSGAGPSNSYRHGRLVLRDAS